jgi:hypothetical protein
LLDQIIAHERACSARDIEHVGRGGNLITEMSESL